MDTSKFAHALAAQAKPVKRMRPPLLRAAGWLVLAAVIIASLTLLHGLRPQFAERMRDGIFMTGMVSSLVTGICAAVAAFHVSLPDRSDGWLFLPVPPLLIWLSTIGAQCFGGWVDVPPGAATAGAAAGCAGTMALTSLPLSLALLIMLRFAARLKPVQTALCGGVAVAAFTSIALSMFHPLDATLMVLGWNLGTMLVFTALAWGLGRRISRRNRAGFHERV